MGRRPRFPRGPGRPSRWNVSLTGLILLVVPLFTSIPVCRAEEGAPDWTGLQKKFRKAFKPLRLPSTQQLEKRIVPALPKGVVIKPGPFEAIVKELQKPFAKVVSLREEVMKGLGAEASARAGKLIKEALKVVCKENGEFARRVAWVEKNYAGAYNKGYMDSGEEEKRVRMLATVLIPFFAGLMAGNDAVLDLAVDALSDMKDGEGFDWLAGTAVKDSEPALRAAAVRALGRIGGDRARKALVNAVGKDTDGHVRARALNALMSWKLAEVKGTVIGALRDPSWEVRALAVAICGLGRLVEATEALIGALEKEEGRLRKDIDDALFLLVGARYYGDAALWKKWLEGNRARVEEKAKRLAEKGAYDKPLGKVERGKSVSAGAGSKDEEGKATCSFYGISTFSKKIIYVIDISRSMLSPAGGASPGAGGGTSPYAKPKGNKKIDIASWQLHRAVHTLPKDAVFNIIVYSDSYKVWQVGMMKATPRFKAEAHKFIDGLSPNGTTNIYDSLIKAFEIAGAAPFGAQVTCKKKKKELAADTIYLLSDGNPNRGRITETDRILEDIRKRNVGIVIHTIGIGEAAGTLLMKRLAGENGGHYVEFR